MGQHVVERRSRSGPRQRWLEAVAQDILDSEGDGRRVGAFIARGAAPCTLLNGSGRGLRRQSAVAATRLPGVADVRQEA